MDSNTKTPTFNENQRIAINSNNKKIMVLAPINEILYFIRRKYCSSMRF